MHYLLKHLLEKWNERINNNYTLAERAALVNDVTDECVRLQHARVLADCKRELTETLDLIEAYSQMPHNAVTRIACKNTLNEPDTKTNLNTLAGAYDKAKLTK